MRACESICVCGVQNTLHSVVLSFKRTNRTDHFRRRPVCNVCERYVQAGKPEHIL